MDSATLPYSHNHKPVLILLDAELVTWSTVAAHGFARVDSGEPAELRVGPLDEAIACRVGGMECL